MKKNTILMILALGMMSGGFYNNAFATNSTEQTAENQQVQKRELTREDAKQLIEDMKARGSTELVIPDGYTSIASSAFDECRELTSVIIPGSVTSIGDSAFRECTGLTSIDLKNVQSIGNDAFHYCESLKLITIPDSVYYVASNAFHGCNKLKFYVPYQNMKRYLIDRCKINTKRIRVQQGEVSGKCWWWDIDEHKNLNVPYGVTKIEPLMFFGREDIKSVKLSDSVAEIGYSAFDGCTGLESISIPNSVQKIGDGAFYACEKLGGVIIPGSVTSIEDAAFSGCSGLTKVTIQDGVMSIGEKAFYGCTGLTSITIPNSVKSIGKDAFSWCDRLTSIAIPDSVESIKQFAFAGCENARFLVESQAMAEELYRDRKVEKDRIFINGSPVDHENAWKWPANLRVEVPKSVVRIDDDMFSNRNIESIDLANVEYIGQYAFFGCTGLTSVTIPDSVTSIGDGAFSGCTGLTSVTIPDSVTSIGDGAFYGCTELTSIVIPDSVTYIGNGAFYGCDNLRHIYVYSDRVRDLVVQNRSNSFLGGVIYIKPSIVKVIKK